MSTDELPILYVKPGCPWCQEAIDYLDEHGIGYREISVLNNQDALEEMRRKSGQTRVPTLDWNGDVLADFGLDELVPFLRKQSVQLEDS